MRMNMDNDDEKRTRRKHGMLKLFYGMDDEKGQGSLDPCDINGAHFKPEVYLDKLVKEKRLTDLMDRESDMVKQIKALDSDMQTLVYENYNKFISATDTIRKMKNDFKKMEDEMDGLVTNMAAITEFSASISNTLQDRRQQINKLSGVHTLLKKLQFLFELPARLKKCIEMKSYSQAVRYYTKARAVLHQYQHMPSFHGIQEDCNEIIAELRTQLREQFRDNDSTPKQLAECVDLLLQLKEPADELCDEFLAHSQQKLDEDLSGMESQLKLNTTTTPSLPSTDSEAVEQALRNIPMDILEYIDHSCNTFLSNMCLVIASYKELFVNRQATQDCNQQELERIAHVKLGKFVNSRMDLYFQYIQERVELEKETGDNTILVRALDRFHRRLQAINRLLPECNIMDKGTEIVSKAAKDRVEHYTKKMQQHFADTLTDARQTLAAPRLVAKQDSTNLSDVLNTTTSSIIDQLKQVLANLQAFIANDITFAHAAYFRGAFCTRDVREGLVVGFLRHINQVAQDLCDGSGDKSSAPPALLLLLSRLLSDFGTSTIGYLLSCTDEQFLVDDKSKVTSLTEICNEAKDAAQKLLNHYVKFQGLTISQMLRKSVETRDWLNTIEPRNVRAVMKRVVEDITSIDSQVGFLYEEGTRKAHSSDSSRRTFSYSTARQKSRQVNYAPSNTMDTSLLSNIQKLFSERIEIFSAVEFSKVSVLTGIIKISLKTFLECVRLRTFGQYGLQQIQVDTHYLQLYLWRFVSDENLVHFLLDEIVGSAVHRCVSPVLMESSVIEVICDRG
ncbi:vacuolar protein sorting-associated protein 51 homolog isoform X2 [Ptychodera flava]|uniref:vacuolar protein sorting-associated protein 51 homolog isoform X2 n=1 Tax=Ptychodera flava TaxID=63121 RepID=UPI00396A2BB9